MTAMSLTSPSYFGDPIGEHLAVRSSVGLADWPRGLLRISGRDRGKFLQGLVTNDVASLKEGEGLSAAITNAKGRTVSIFDLVVLPVSLGGVFLLIMEPSLAEKTAQFLAKYRLGSEVKIDDVTQTRPPLLLSGPAAPAVLDIVLAGRLPAIAENHLTERQIAGKSVLIVRTFYTGEEGFLLLPEKQDAETVFHALMEAGRPLSIRPVGGEALESLRIEAGIPRYGIDIDEEIIPVEAGLEKAISYSKGCYIGQEVLARIKTYGHVNKHLLGIVLEGDALPEREDLIIDPKDQRESGWVTSAVRSTSLARGIAIGYLRPWVAAPGSPVEIRRGEKMLKGSVRPLPFYSRQE